MYFAIGIAVIMVFIIISLLCSKSFIFLKLIKHSHTDRDTERLQPGSSSILKEQHSWSRLYKFLLILCLLFACMYFIFLRFFGCTDPFDESCLGALTPNTTCSLKCVNKKPIIDGSCTMLENNQIEVS